MLHRRGAGRLRKTMIWQRPVVQFCDQMPGTCSSCHDRQRGAMGCCLVSRTDSPRPLRPVLDEGLHSRSK